ncbi:MAG TPA: DUF2459 domain-containing protein [Steroidobacteraceae bacterium]|nr:DUF2459 domain-containing protein [Steroidobacteraceae bacterium]
MPGGLSLTAAVVALTAGLLSACVGAPRHSSDVAARRDAAAAAAAASVYVVKRGWHVDVGFATADLSAPLSSVASQFPRARYLLFGFGDRRYLTARHRNLDALAAALWRGPGLMLVTALVAPPWQAFGAGHVVQLPLDESQVRVLQAFVWRALSSRQGMPIVIGSGPYPGSLYLGSGERYSAFHTCNTWAAEALHAAAVPVRSAGVIFAAQLWRQVHRVARQDRGGADRRRASSPPVSQRPAAAAQRWSGYPRPGAA